MALEHVMQANTQLCLKLDSMCSPQPYIRDMILGHYGKRFESDSKSFVTDKNVNLSLIVIIILYILWMLDALIYIYEYISNGRRACYAG